MADSNGVSATTDSGLREIVIDTGDLAIRFTPRELRLIREHTGRSYSEISADETSDDRFTVMAWLKARRDGHPVDWDDMDDIVISITNSAVDPTTAVQAAISRSSAASTG